jgi:hypothetical protein
MPLQATSGSASYDAFGGGVPVVPAYIEEVFSTYLYTGNGSTQTITNGIDLSTKGGLVWIKDRGAAQSHNLYDTARGALDRLMSNQTAAASSTSGSLTSFNTNGFSLGSWDHVNFNNNNFVSWTFRKQPKFFDVVTWTGTGSSRTISHNLGSVPGCVIIKRTSSTSNWSVWHTAGSDPAFQQNGQAFLNLTDEYYVGDTMFLNPPTSTELSFTGATNNNNGSTFVAYLFAHNAGGFGLTGTDNVISCGSFTSDGSGNASVTLGYEPQWVMYKAASTSSAWVISDTMRGWNAPATASQRLFPHLSNAESSSDISYINSTGMQFGGSATLSPDSTYIYIAIRRGPMKVPTSGTSVFSPDAYTGTATLNSQNIGFSPDLLIGDRRDSWEPKLFDKLRGPSKLLCTLTTSAEVTSGATYDLKSFDSLGFTLNASNYNTSLNGNGGSDILWAFKRAISFFDIACYTGTGSNTTITHSLGSVPELIIVKRRDAASAGSVYSSANANTEYLVLNTTAAKVTDATRWNSTTPTSSVFSIGTSTHTNTSAGTYVAYLFSTCAGVSKVGSYTGTGTTLQINCGFTAGARFVLIKRTDSTGNWYVWDTGRGIVSGNDPFLSLNTSTAETTNTDYIDTYSAGFEISSTAPAAINASGGTFIFLAIA